MTRHFFQAGDRQGGKNKKQGNRGDMRKIYMTQQFFEPSGPQGHFFEKLFFKFGILSTFVVKNNSENRKVARIIYKIYIFQDISLFGTHFENTITNSVVN